MVQAVGNRLYVTSLESINFWVNYAQKLIDDGIISSEQGKRHYEDTALNCLANMRGNSGFIVEFTNKSEEDIYITKYDLNDKIVIYNENTHHQHNIALIDNKIHKIYFTGLNDFIEVENYQSFSDIGKLTEDEMMYITLKYDL